MDIMKYTKRRRTRGWLLAALCVFAVSCIRDGEYMEPEAPSPENSVRVEILLRTPESGGMTRALTAQDESRIDDVLVLFFQKDGMQLHSVAQGSKLTPSAGDGRTYTFETSFSVESALATKPFTCIVLANVADRYDVSTRQSWRGKTYDVLQAELTQQVTGKLHTSAAEDFAMWGRANEELIPSKPQQRLSVPLLRNVARVDVAVAAEVQNFTLTKAYIYKPNNALSMMPITDNVASDGRKVSKPSVPTGTAALTENWLYSVANNQIDYSIYIPEADVVQGGDGTPGDANHLNRCAIVVGGNYGGSTSETYYRIDFKHGEGDAAKGSLMDVLRNHRYAVNITAVLGPGEATPDAAYESRTADVTAEIVTWTDNNQDIVFDGTNWASVERKEMHFGDGMGSQELLQLLSNVQPSQWKLQFSVPEENITGTESTDQTVVGTYFEVVKPTDKADAPGTTQGGNLTIRTRQALPEYKDGSTTEKNETLHEVLTVRIGRLELKIDLYQHPYADTDWDDGGKVEGGF